MLVPPRLHVAVDVGCRRHSVAIGLSSGELLEAFDIAHCPEGFEDLFGRIEQHHRRFAGAEPTVAMEGYNGHARERVRGQISHVTPGRKGSSLFLLPPPSCCR
ncbi:MAG: hypothetical protein WBG92_10105 [Thiohalocapsa sp.]